MEAVRKAEMDLLMSEEDRTANLAQNRVNEAKEREVSSQYIGGLLLIPWLTLLRIIDNIYPNLNYFIIQILCIYFVLVYLNILFSEQKLTKL